MADLAAHRARRAGREPYKTKAQLAAHFAVSERTVERWGQRGLRKHPWGRRCVRYLLSEAEAFVDGLEHRSCGV